ncbi:unnamed protein product [Rotaria sp. Silwood2]|nr:unnamed protein product [Rotaria sp. Silwood2]CAF2520178.1 unnamed protein product [Rotaria sp. Silwood2]CAF2951099.1 unnamed protein product [Rotaria sp. Silwood2]
MKNLLVTVVVATALVFAINAIPTRREANEISCEHDICLNDIFICICGSTLTPDDPCGCPFRCTQCSFEYLPSFNFNFTGIIFPEIDWSNLVFDFSNLNLNLGKKK